MEISAEKIDGDILRIKLAGRLDSEGAYGIETRLAAYMAVDNGKVVVDLSGVSFLASLGIRAILISAKALQRRGGKIALFNPVAGVAKVMKLVSLDRLMPICDSEDAAKAAVAA